MKIKELKSLIDKCDPNADVLSEDPIHNDTYKFDVLMGVCGSKDSKGRSSVMFYVR